MIVVTGTVARIIEREAHSERTGNRWTEHTIAVADFGRTDYVKASRAVTEAGLPKVGDKVVFEVMNTAFLDRQGQPQVGLLALGRLSAEQVEAALFGEPTRAAV